MEVKKGDKVYWSTFVEDMKLALLFGYVVDIIPNYDYVVCEGKCCRGFWYKDFVYIEHLKVLNGDFKIEEKTYEELQEMARKNN